jgi:hypothetical protein
MAETIKSHKIKRGHSLTGLDHGYVVEVEVDEYDVRIGFHTAEGDEGWLTLPHGVPVKVDDATPHPVW